MTPTKLLCVICLLTVWTTTQGKTAEEWKTRVIYQLLTDRFSPEGDTPITSCADLRSWCGGNFRGITQRLDYIENLGANAIWISPIILNTAGGYHGYWAKDIYQIDPHFGTEQDLKDLIAAAHEKDIWVMVDVVPNHMGYPVNCSWDSCLPGQLFYFNDFVPFNKSEHYHAYCLTEDWLNQTQVEQCRLANLPDLNQTVPYVRQTLLEWISDLTSRLGIDGYRVDTTKHVAIDFWPEYQQAASAFCLGEVWYEDDYQYVAKYQGPDGLDAVFNYPLLRAIKNVFHYGQAMTLLDESLRETRQYFPNPQALGVFIDNHDMSRFLHDSPDVAKLKSALTYILFTEGIPVIYYGSEQEFNGGHDPDCRESLWPYYNTQSPIYKFIKEGLVVRNAMINSIIGSRQEILYVDTTSLIFTRAQNEILVAMTNIGQSGSITREFFISDVAEGTRYENIRDSNDLITVDRGKSSVTLEQGEPKVYLKLDENPSSAMTIGYSFMCLASALLLAVLR